MEKKTEKTAPIAPIVTFASNGEINQPHVPPDSASAVEHGLRKYDVLTGRGSGSNQSEGNIAFRQVVFQTYQEYVQELDRKHLVGREQTAPQDECYPRTLDGTVKNLLAGQVLAKVREHNGRFLRRICKEDYRNLKPEDKDRLIRVFVFPWQEVSNKTVGEHQESSSQQKGENEKSPDAPSGANVFPTLQETLYVELSPKDTMEKIKQSLRFQMNRLDHRGKRKLLQQQSHLSTKQKSSRKRLNIDQSSMRLVFANSEAESAVAGWEMRKLEKPPKRLAASLGISRMNGFEALFGVSPAPTAGFAASVARKPFGKESAKNIFASHRLLMGSPYNNATIDSSSWPSSRPLELDGTGKAAASVDCQYNREQQNGKKEQTSLITSVGGKCELKDPTLPSTGSCPTKPSLFCSTTQMEALALKQLLVQENRDSDIDALHRHQDLMMACSILERFNRDSNLPYAPAVGDILSLPSLIKTSTPLQSILAQEFASRRLSTTYGFETRTLPTFADRRLCCMPGTGLPTFCSTGNVLESLLRQGSPANSTTDSFNLSDSDRVATHRTSNVSISPSLSPSWFATSKTQRDGEEGKKRK